MLQPSILKSHKHPETHFYRLYSIMTGSIIIAGSPSKVWHLILLLLSVFYSSAQVCYFCWSRCCVIGGGQWLINGCENLSRLELEHKKWQGKGCSKNTNAIFIFFAYELWVKRVGTFGVVLYHNQWSVNFILCFTELQIGGSIKYKITLFWNYFLRCYKVNF